MFFAEIVTQYRHANGCYFEVVFPGERKSCTCFIIKHWRNSWYLFQLLNNFQVTNRFDLEGGGCFWKRLMGVSFTEALFNGKHVSTCKSKRSDQQLEVIFCFKVSFDILIASISSKLFFTESVNHYRDVNCCYLEVVFNGARGSCCICFIMKHWRNS